MNYTIIKNKKAFKEFIEWLPELRDGEQYYYSLFARKKYDHTGVLKSDKSQIARGTSSKDWLFDKIKKLEVEIGAYKTGEIAVPQESLALYITPNPRCMKKASIKTAKEILNNVEKDRYQNPKAVALNAIQTSKSRTVFVDFDIDNKGYCEGELRTILDVVTGNADSYNIVETRGGFHILVQPELTTNKRWYQDILKNFDIDQKGDLLLPVPGCFQGGYVPVIYK